MRFSFRHAFAQVVALVALVSPLFGQTPVDRWVEALTAFDAADRTAPPIPGSVLFVGSSTIVGWDVTQAFPFANAINRGVWSATLAETVRRFDRLVVPYAPRLIVVYAGENDIHGGATSEQVAVEFERFVALVHGRFPQTRILFIGLKPTLARWPQMYRMRLTNAIIRDYCEHDDRLAFLDVEGAMLGWNEQPRADLFVSDGLHLSPQGYELWTLLVKPYLAPPPGMLAAAPATSTPSTRP